MPDDSRTHDDPQPPPAEAGPRPSGQACGVVILGMSRSGTSAVSEAFARSGFFAGQDPDLMPPTAFNPRGYWENYGVYRANEAVLAELDASWFDPPGRAQMKASAHLRERLRGALDLLVEMAASAPVVVKDPRIGVLLDLWGPAIEGRLHPVLVVRSPAEIASSLATRDGTPRALGLAGWEVHTTGVLDYLRGRIVTVAPYEGMLADPAQASLIVEDAASHLEASRRAVVDATDAPTVMIAGLRRHRPDPGELAECLTATQARLWRILRDLPPGDQVIELPPEFTGSPAEAALEAVRDETRRAVAPRLARDQEIRIDGLSADRHAVASERDALRLERDALGLERERIAGELANERAVVAGLRAELGRAVYQIDERARHRAERDAMAAERDAMAAERDAMAAERDAIRIARDAIAAERDAIAAELGRRSAGV